MNRHCLSIVLVIAAAPLFAQPHPKTKELSDSVAAQVCQCMDNTFLGVDSDIKELITHAISDPLNGPSLIQKCLSEVDEQRARQITEQLQKFGSIDSDLACCFDDSTTRLKNLQLELEGLSASEQTRVAGEFESEEKTIALVMESMKTRSDCSFAYHFIKLGLELAKK